MCGQFGVQWRERPGGANIPLFAVLEVLMDDRGGHSWGFWADGVVRKGLGRITESIPARTLGGVKTLIAHTRLATTGKICESNSHPFEMGKIVGTHNGMIYNHEDLARHYDRKFEVDSMHIFAHLDEGQDLQELRGYGSAVWLHTDDLNTINFVRWNSGDLAIAEIYSKDKKLLGTAWASTPEALVPAIETTGLVDRLIKVDEERHYYTKNAEVFAENEKSMKFGFGSKGASTFSSHADKIGGEWVKNVWTAYENGVLPAPKPVQIYSGFRHKQKPTPIEVRDTLAKQGLKAIQRPGGVTIKNKSQFEEWPKDTLTQSRKCMNCDLANMKTVRHPEIGVALCYDCTKVTDSYDDAGLPIIVPNTTEHGIALVANLQDVVTLQDAIKYEGIDEDTLDPDEVALLEWMREGRRPESGTLYIPNNEEIEFPPRDWVGMI